MAYQAAASVPPGWPEGVPMPFAGQTSQKFFYSSDIDCPVKLKMCVPTFPSLQCLFYGVWSPTVSLPSVAPVDVCWKTSTSESLVCCECDTTWIILTPKCCATVCVVEKIVVCRWMDLQHFEITTSRRNFGRMIVELALP